MSQPKKKTKMPKEPKKGDKYYPFFSNEFDKPSDLPKKHLIITTVAPYGDNDKCCHVTAKDEDDNTMGYDCMWSKKLQAWVYNADNEHKIKTTKPKIRLPTIEDIRDALRTLDDGIIVKEIRIAASHELVMKVRLVGEKQDERLCVKY